jgi:hypothetical protein
MFSDSTVECFEEWLHNLSLFAYVRHVLGDLACYNLVLDVVFYFSYFNTFTSLPSLLLLFLFFLTMVLFSCSEALVGSQRRSVTLRNVACVQPL